MSERLDIRLSEEEKKRLAELATQRGVSMTDLVRTWITRGDVVHVLAEQLEDFVDDFDKWHVSENRNTSIRYLCEHLQGRTGFIKDDPSRQKVLYQWIGFFMQSFDLLKRHVSVLKTRVGKFIKQKEPKMKDDLIGLILQFILIVYYYDRIFLQGFLNILQNMDEQTKHSTGATYNDEFRTRYNEIASKLEDFLKRAERELGHGMEKVIPRAKEFRAEE